MVRSWWLGPLVLTMAGGGSVWAQSAPERSSAGNVRERFMTITEQGKSPRRCRIIQTGSMPDGSRVYLVSAVDDGHRITVVQAPRKPDGSVAPTKFYHWTTEGKPPAAIASLVVQEEGVSESMASAEVVKPVSAPARLNAGFENLAPAPAPVATPSVAPTAPLPVVEPRAVAMRVPSPEPVSTPAVAPSVVAMGSSKAVEGKGAEGFGGKNGKGAVEGTKGGKAAEAGTKGSDGGKAAKAADPGVKGGKAAEAGTKGSDGGKAAKAADPGTKGGKAAEAGTKGSDGGKAAKAADPGTKGGKAAEAGTKGSDGGKAAKAADPGVKGGKAAEAGTKGSDGGKAAKAADPGTKGGKAAEAGTKGSDGGKAAKAADPGTKGGKAAEAGTKGSDGGKAAKAADPGTKGGKAAEAGTKGSDVGRAADPGTKGGKGAVDPTTLPFSKASAGDPLKAPLDYQKSSKGQREAGETLMEKLRRTLGMGNNPSDGSDNNGFADGRGSRRGRRLGTRSMEAAGVTGDFGGVGEGFPIMLGTAPVNPPSFRDLPKPPYAPNLPGPETNPYVASPDRGVSPGMANAFTSTSSTRPIPADFGGQPINRNAFSQPAMPGPAPVAQVNLPVPGMNPLPPQMVPGQMGLPHQATPIQALPGGASAGGRGLGLSLKKSKVDDDGQNNAFTTAPAVAPQPMMLPAQQAQLAAVLPPQATVLTTTAGTTKGNTLETPVRQLRESLLPSERESAIDALAESDLRANKEATSALLTAAFRDPAITVRLSAIRTLAAKLGGNPQIIGALRALKEDGDARVRAEAESALNQAGSDLPAPPSMPKAIVPRTFPGGN